MLESAFDALNQHFIYVIFITAKRGTKALDLHIWDEQACEINTAGFSTALS